MQRAEGDASRFRQILAEYAKAPGVTRERLYLDMMQSVVGNASKVMIDQKAGGNLLYLPLDKLIQQSSGAAPRRAAPPRRRGAGAAAPATPAPEPPARRSAPLARRAAQPRARGDSR